MQFGSPPSGEVGMEKLVAVSLVTTYVPAARAGTWHVTGPCRGAAMSAPEPGESQNVDSIARLMVPAST